MNYFHTNGQGAQAFTGCLGVIFWLCLGFGNVGWAQTTAFTYQGKLTDAGTPANGSYDLQFRLFDALIGGNQVPSTATLIREDVAVSNGLFTVTLDFGAAAFPGAQRWLEISVRPGVSTGAFTTLAPLQSITSTPYAVRSLNAAAADSLSVTCVSCVTSNQIGSLPTNSGNYIQNTSTPQASSNFNISGNGTLGGVLTASTLNSSALRQELNVNAPPNLINGFLGTGSGGAMPGNRVTAGVAGASIGGGGFNGVLNLPNGGTLSGDNSNRVTDWFGTVGGGFWNRAGNDDATLFNASYATVGGGVTNTASGYQATVGGGNGNTASGDLATVGGGGYGNTASGEAATVGGGGGNTASSGHATVSGGLGNTTDIPNTLTPGGSGPSIGGGFNNRASGAYATVPGGRSNTASGDYSFAAGHRAFAQHQGAFVWADSTEANFGSSAANQFLIRASGGVGIGTSTPNNLLTVNGNASFGGVVASPGEPVEVQGTAAGVSYYDRTLGGAASRWVTYANGGNFHIWKGSDKVTILGNGNLCAANIQCNSDARLKTQITGLHYGLAQLLRLRPVSWQWKDATMNQLPMGLIAQEVEVFMPELVLQPAQASGMLGLNYMGLLPVMIKATQEQQAQIEQQQAQIEIQKAQLKQQQQQLDALKKLVCQTNPQAAACQE